MRSESGAKDRGRYRERPSPIRRSRSRGACGDRGRPENFMNAVAVSASITQGKGRLKASLSSLQFENDPILVLQPCRLYAASDCNAGTLCPH